jgi:hypothetical protein
MPMKTVAIAVMIAAFSATIVLPAMMGHDAAYAATKKAKKKSCECPMRGLACGHA